MACRFALWALSALFVLSCSKEPPLSSSEPALVSPKALALPVASVTPNPSTYSFTVSADTWHTFTVHTDADSVRVIVNPPGSDVVLAVAGGSTPPTTSRCPAERSDQPPALKNTWKLYLQACGEGTTSIVIEEFYYDHPIKRYEGIHVSASPIEAGTAATDRDVLETLYQATGGDQWSRNTNWLRDDVPLSQWAGVFTNPQDRVTSLFLSQNQLSGSIPETLGNLEKLETLSLWGNQLSGSIPASLGSLSNLETLSLSFNQLSGSIPASLGNLSNLKYLRLSYNSLTGCFPVSWRDVPFHDLESTGLPFCDTGEDDGIDDGSSEEDGIGEDDGAAADRAILVALYQAVGGDLWDRERKPNWLRDDVPLSQWGGVITNDQDRVVMLSLWAMRLRGEIPPELGNLAHLEWLDLHGNQLSGAIPESLGNLSKLEQLNLSDNQLSGSIPASLGNLSNLETLRLDENQLSGPIPPELGNLAILEHLWLDDNELSGPIPAELGQLTFLKSLNLSGNQLTGCLPASWRDADIEDFTWPRLPFCGFNIELVFVDDSFTPAQQDIIRDAAAHWERVIIGDVPDIDHYQQYPMDEWSDFLEGQIQVNDVIDDLRIFVAARDIDGWDGTVALAWPSEIRTIGGLPILAQIKCDPAVLSGGTEYFYSVMLHEIGHALGFGTIWRYLGLLQNPSLDSAGRVDTYFSGGLARVAFDHAGGRTYTGRKVPVENSPLFGVDVHWREFVFWNELMSSFLWSDDIGIAPLSAITIQAIADMGYTVDVSQADPYTLPLPSAKRPVQAADGPPACRVIPPAWAVDLDGQRVPVGE